MADFTKGYRTKNQHDGYAGKLSGRGTDGYGISAPLGDFENAQYDTEDNMSVTSVGYFRLGIE